MEPTETPTPTVSPEQPTSPAPEKKPFELNHLHIKWLVMVFIIFFCILVAFLLILHFEKQGLAGEKDAVNPAPSPSEQAASGQSSPAIPQEIGGASTDYLPEEDYILERKEECEKLSGDEQAKCYDEYYYLNARSSLDESYCEQIQDLDIKNECLLYN